MLKDFSIKVVDEQERLKRLVVVSACDYEMAKCMVYSVLNENEYMG